MDINFSTLFGLSIRYTKFFLRVAPSLKYEFVMMNNFKSRLHETKPSLDFNEASMIDWMMLDFLNSSWLSPRVYWNYLLMCLETRCERSFFKRNCSYFYYFMSTFWLEWRKWFKEGQFIRRALDFFPKNHEIYFQPQS